MSTNQEKGRNAEDRVQSALEKRGYKLLRKRWRTPYAELDLLMASEDEFLIVEVKTISDRGFVEHRVSLEQRARLRRAQIFLQSRSRFDVRLLFAFVEPDGKIVLFNPGEEDLH